MAEIFVAVSKALQDWGAEVGVSKHLYLVGVDDDPAGKIAELNAAAHAGVADWALARKGVAPAPEGLDRAGALERLAKRERVLDPRHYPRLRGADDVLRVQPKTVETALLMAQAMSDKQMTAVKAKPADFVAYLLRNAAG